MWANKLKIAYPILLVLGGEEKSLTIEDPGMNNNTKSLLLELLDVQRNYLVELNKDPNISEAIIRHQLYLWDLEEESLRLT
jgi:hypothetical protein